MRRLYCWDLDGTLIRSFLREGGERADYDLVEVLPERRARLSVLAAGGASFALVTNQAGVAMGYQTIEQVWRKMGVIVAAFEGFYGAALSIHVCPFHPKAKVGQWQQDPCSMRKPEPGMLVQAMMRHGVKRSETLFVGDLDTDREAAERAGVAFEHADEFFGPAERDAQGHG